MHKSCLGAVVIDCRTEDLEAAGAFWGAALGHQAKITDDPRYLELDLAQGQLKVIIQRVEHESRVHLDIETDDVEAEVTRLEGLGAKRIHQIKTWWVMEAPTGQRFCVVKPQAEDFAARAQTYGAKGQERRE
jgi:predicted enzyme related to lactoylglutathione lyase